MDLLGTTVWDADVAVLATKMCLRSGILAVLDNCKQLVERYPAMLLPKVLLSRLHGETGALDSSCVVALSAVESVPDSLLLNQQLQRARRGQNQFCQPDALWRRWTKVACLHQGNSMTAADMAVVVLSQRASHNVEAIVELWPQSDIPAMKLADFLIEQGTQECDDAALELLRNLATVMPDKNMPVARICAILEKNDNTLVSMREAEKACLMCPTQAAFWWRLNGVSSSLGLHAMQVYALQMILIQNPANDAAQQALGQLHRILGDSDLADKRLAAAA